jgi:hypothetical protein
VRPDVAIVIYDSRTTPGERQAVYIGATAMEIEHDDLDAGISPSRASRCRKACPSGA